MGGEKPVCRVVFSIDFGQRRQICQAGFPQNQAGRLHDRKRQAVKTAVGQPQIIAEVFGKILKQIRGRQIRRVGSLKSGGGYGIFPGRRQCFLIV